MHWIRFIRFAFDTSDMLPVIQQATAYLRGAGAAPSRFWAYVLVRDVEDAHRRVLALRDMGVMPFAQPYRDYDGREPTDEQQRFSRWVNQKVLFKSCNWEDFRKERQEAAPILKMRQNQKGRWTFSMKKLQKQPKSTSVKGAGT